jgi:hypothetical protein
LDDLDVMAQALHVGVPDALRTAVAEIGIVEQKKATWSRYSVSWEGPRGNKQLLNHMKQEAVLPLGKIQNLLQAANDALGSIWPFNGLMMGNLGMHWERLARQAGELD